jgi:SAM-dependent methyltransferase
VLSFGQRVSVLTGIKLRMQELVESVLLKSARRVIGCALFRLRMYRVIWDVAGILDYRRYVLCFDLRGDVTREFEETGKADAAFLIDYLRPHDVVLDFGVGPGRIEPGIASHVKVIYGVDISPVMIGIASGRLKVYHNIRLFAVRNLGASLPSSFFTFVFSWGVLHHMNETDVRTVLHEMDRAMKPGGRFLHYVSRCRGVTYRGYTFDEFCKLLPSTTAADGFVERDKSVAIIGHKRES